MAVGSQTSLAYPLHAGSFQKPWEFFLADPLGHSTGPAEEIHALTATMRDHRLTGKQDGIVRFHRRVVLPFQKFGPRAGLELQISVFFFRHQFSIHKSVQGFRVGSMAFMILLHQRSERGTALKLLAGPGFTQVSHMHPNQEPDADEDQCRKRQKKPGGGSHVGKCSLGSICINTSSMYSAETQRRSCSIVIMILPDVSPKLLELRVRKLLEGAMTLVKKKPGKADLWSWWKYDRVSMISE